MIFVKRGDVFLVNPPPKVPDGRKSLEDEFLEERPRKEPPVEHGTAVEKIGVSTLERDQEEDLSRQVFDRGILPAIDLPRGSFGLAGSAKELLWLRRPPYLLPRPFAPDLDRGQSHHQMSPGPALCALARV